MRAATITSVGPVSFDVAIGYSGFVPTGITVNAAAQQLNVAGLGDVLVDTGGLTPGNVSADALNLPSPSQAVLLTFSLGGISPDLTLVLLNSSGTTLLGPITDPTLALFLGPASYVFGVDPASLTGFDTGTGNGTLVYDFAGGDVSTAPEPGTLVLIGAALVVGGRLRRYCSR